MIIRGMTEEAILVLLVQSGQEEPWIIMISDGPLQHMKARSKHSFHIFDCWHLRLIKLMGVYSSCVCIVERGPCLDTGQGGGRVPAWCDL